MSFKGPLPAGQPRSLRSIVESKALPKNLAPPEKAPESPGTYTPLVCPEPTARRETAAGKSPFKGAR